MKLPYLDNLVIPEDKITKYLLNLEHPSGGSKAVFFYRFGFTLDAWEELDAALRQHANNHETTSILEVDDGVKYVIEGRIISPDNRNPFVRVVWEIDKAKTYPRFITALPLKEPKGGTE